jgi:hypothetical protein
VEIAGILDPSIVRITKPVAIGAGTEHRIGKGQTGRRCRIG